MNRPLSICAVSGGRADYGLLLAPLRAIQADPRFRLSLVLTGQHLVGTPGQAAQRAQADGLVVAAEIDMAIERDDALAVTKSSACALEGMGKLLAHSAPDIMLILGDRYEILCCALAATIARIPIAHIAGGDVTEGAFDDAFRHSITKMSHLHFVTNEAAARRVHQLGEAADRIFVVGSPGLDLIRTTSLPSREDFFGSLGLMPRDKNFVVTFHPVTLKRDSLQQFEELLTALSSFEDAAILFTGSNADPEGRQIDERCRSFVKNRSAAHFVPSLGSAGYFAALTYMDIVIGNSSSGLYEAPSFGIPTVNIGDRQKGRPKADSVLDCAPERGAIDGAIHMAMSRGKRPTVNPYGDGHASKRIVAVLAELDSPQALLTKRFIDLETA